ncbi:MAG: Asp-tRNA(Asn)/Glu-tRNA(Gln) amidotransferase subunit GatA [Candidatus Anammoxibacter sp.]
MNLTELTATQIKEKVLTGELSAETVIIDILDRIGRKDAKIGSYLSLNKEKALLKAKEIDKKIKSGQSTGMLTGIPVAVKDNICTVDLKTTCASKILSNFQAPYNAHVIERIDKEDGIIIGKTNLDEFAMGSSTEHSSYHVTHNPWDLDCVPGGSSGGAAAAVAADMAYLSLGSDTGGSVRQPASFCGVVGLKPTYGRISRYGLVAFGSSLDQIGTISKNVSDSALLLQTIAGHDQRDTTCSDVKVSNYLDQLECSDCSITIGVPKEYFAEGINTEVRKAVEDALDVYRNLGATIVEISLPHTEFAVAVYYIIACAEASSNLSRYDGVRYGYRAQKCNGIVDMYERSRSESFGSEVKRRIIMGNYVLSSGYYDAYYLKASKVRTLIKNDFDLAFSKVDCIVCPTSPIVAHKIGERISDPLEMYLLDIYTSPANLAGIPGISVPCGLTNSGLPIGMQILGKHFDELRILQVARLFESATDYHTVKPKFNTDA